MSNLTNFNNFELNTEETTNVEGGWGCSRRRTSYSSNNCYPSYSNNCYSSCSYNNCEPAAGVEVAPVEEVIIDVAPVVEAPAAPIARGVQGA